MIAQMSRRQKTALLVVLPWIFTLVLLNLIDVVPGPKNFTCFAFWIILTAILYTFSVSLCVLGFAIYRAVTYALTILYRRFFKPHAKS